MLLSTVIARHVGEVLTLDRAKEIVNAMCDLADLSVNPAQFDPDIGEGFTLQCERLKDASVALVRHREAYLSERYPDRPQAINWGLLLDMALAGELVIFTARARIDGELLASLWLFPGRSIDTGSRTVTDDMFYVLPQHRGGMMAVRLWQYAERAMFALGVREATFHSRMDSGAERMARFMGYQPDSIRVVKRHVGDDFAKVSTRHKETS